MTRCVAVVLLALSIACGGANETTPKSPRPELRPVALPDIASASPEVQARLRERHESLTRTINDTTSTPGALADAYGDMARRFGISGSISTFPSMRKRSRLRSRSLVDAVRRWSG